VAELTHLDEHGRARMVDVNQKPPTHRQAVARCAVVTSAETVAAVTASSNEETDVFAAARVIGTMAAKRTPELIPLCHPLLIGNVEIEFTPGPETIEVAATVECFGRTGVEMEALTACAAAALAVCDLCRALDPLVSIQSLRVWEKRGGRSGTWRYVPTGS
jgi:cyclic pyranopterin phosphate synthase